MRNPPNQMSDADVHGLASIAVGLLKEIIKAFAKIRSAGQKVPASSALELQHVCMHFAAISEAGLSDADKKAHFSSAVGHCRRCLLDAYKTFIFEWKNNNGLDAYQQKIFSKYRILELHFGFAREYEKVIASYKGLFELLINANEPDVVRSTSMPAEPAYWKNVRKWLELEMLISSLRPSGVKDIAFLRRLLNSFIFDQNRLGISPTEYLAETVAMQKTTVFRLMLAPENFRLLADFKKSLVSREQIAILDECSVELQSGKPKNLEDYKRVTAQVFTLFVQFFQLKQF